MKKFSVCLLLLLCFASNLFASLEKKQMVNEFGAIRAEMIRNAYEIAGFSDTNVIKKINSVSLDSFLTELEKHQEAKILFNIIKTSNKPLDGVSIPTYQRNLELINDSLASKLSRVYPDKINLIEDYFTSFEKQIDQLALETAIFNNVDIYLYQRTYPNGRFIIYIPENSRINNISAPSLKDDKESITNYDASVLDISHLDDNMSADNNNAYKTSFWILVLVCIFYLFHKNKDRIKKLKPIIFNRMIHISGTGERNTDNSQTRIEEQDSNESVTTFSQKELIGNSVDELAETTPIGDETPIVQLGNPTELSTEETAINIDPLGDRPSEDDTNLESPDEKKYENAFSLENGKWIVVGASVQGNAHISMGDIPCQDCSIYHSLSNGWGIAVIADGAGSAKMSQIGSHIAVQRCVEHTKNMLSNQQWIEKNYLPSERDWDEVAYIILKKVYDDIEKFASVKQIASKDLSSTLILVIHSPLGLLVSHVGDGRAGYRNLEGLWQSMITPHKGEEANQTIFLPSKFWNIPYFRMSGARVPESRVITDKVTAFTLMSDGCESTAWSCNIFDEMTGKYKDPNKPFEGFFEPLVKTLREFHHENVPNNIRLKKWYSFIKAGNKSFIRESDDKTIVLATLI